MQQTGGQLREADDDGVEAVGSHTASGSLNMSNAHEASNLRTAHSGPDAALSLPSTTMAAAATTDATASAASGAVAAPATGQPRLLNRTNSERLGQKPNQRKTFQELMSIRNEDRRVTETLLSENTEFETTLGLEEYSLNSGKSLVESVQHHRNSRSAHVRHHEEVSSVDIWQKSVEHVYKSNFRMPDGSSVAVTHQEVYHTTDPNVEVTVCLAQSLPSADCRPGRANVAELAAGNEWASLLLSCDGFRDDQLCSMLLKKEGEHGAEAAAEAAAVASSVAAAVSLAAADSSPLVVDVSLSSEITHPLPNAFVALYGEDENVSADSSSAESVVEVAKANNRTNPPSKLASTELPQKTKYPINSTYQEFQKQTEDTRKGSAEAKTPVSEQHTKSTETSIGNSGEPQATLSEAKKSKDPIKPARPEEPLKESRQLKTPAEQQRSRRRPNRALQRNDALPAHSEGSDTTSGATAAIDVALQQRMEAFLESKKTKSEKLQHVAESESTTSESNVTVLEEVSVASNDLLTVFRAPTQSARLSVSEKMCMEVLAEPYDPDASDSDDENSTRPRGFYSYLCDGPKSRPSEEDDSVRIFRRVETTERRLTRGEVLAVEFCASSADNSSIRNVNRDVERDDKSHDNSRYHMVYVRDPTANSYVKVHEPIYDDVSPKGSDAPSESSSDPGNIDEPHSTTAQRHTASQYLDNPLSPISPNFQQTGSDHVDMRIWYATSKTPSSSVSATRTTTPTTSQQVSQLTVVTDHDSGTLEEQFSPGIVKRRAEQYEVRRAIRNQTAEERKSHQELINSGIVQVKRREHEDLIEKDAMPPSPSDFRFEVEPDQLERVVYQKEQVLAVAPAHPSASSPKEASVVAPIIRQMEKEAAFEYQPAKSSSNQQYRSRPGKKGSDQAPFKPAVSGESLIATSSSARVKPPRVGRGEIYPAQDDRSSVLPIEKPSTETANAADEPQPFSPRSVESEAVLRYDRSQENRWYSVSGSGQGTHSDLRLLKTQTSEEQGKLFDPDAAGRSETLRYDRAQENLLPSAALGKVTHVEHLTGNDSKEDTKFKISTQSERFELKQLPPASTSEIVGTSEDSSPSSAESDGGGDYDTGYEQQYELQEVLKKVKPKPPKGQHHPQKPPHELSSLTEADDEREFESEGDNSSEGSSQVLVDEDVLSDQQLFLSTGHAEQKPPISILIDDENSITSLLVQDASSESASSESDEDNEDDDYSETVRRASEWYESHPVEDMYLPRRRILATIDEETVSLGSTSIPSQSTDAEVTVISRQSDLSNQDTILVRPPSPSKVTSSVAPVVTEEDLSGSGASDSDKATKTQSPKVPQEAEADIDNFKTTPSSQYRSAVRLPVSIQVAKVAQTDAQLIREQNSHASTTQLQSSDGCVTTFQESSAGDKASEQNKYDQFPVDPTEKPIAANADSDRKRKTKKKKEHHRSKERHRPKSPKLEPSNEKSNFEFKEEAFEKTSIQSQRHNAKIKTAEGSQDKSSSSSTEPVSSTKDVEKTVVKPALPQSEPPSGSNVSGFKSKSTELAESEVKSKTTEKKERRKLKESESLPPPKQQEESQGKVPIQQPPILPTPVVSSEADSETSNKSEPPPPTRLIRSSFRSSSGRKSKTAAEEKKKRPKSSSEDANVDQLVKTVSNADKDRFTISKPLAPTDSNGDSVSTTATPAAPAAESKPESDHRSQKTKKDTKARIARRQTEDVPAAPEPVLIEDNIEKLDIYAQNSQSFDYKSSRPSRHEGREIQSQPQLWRSRDSQNKQDSTKMPELVAYAAPSYSSKKAASPTPAQQQTALTPDTMQDLPCVDASSMQTRPHRLSGSSLSPERTLTPPPATESPAAAKPAEEEKKPDNKEQKKPRRSKKDKPKVMHFSDRRRSPEPKKAEEEDINADSGEEGQREDAPADSRIDRWIDNSNKHLVGQAGRPTITGVALGQPPVKDVPIAAPRNPPRKPEYQRQETGGFAPSDAAPDVNPIVVVKEPPIERLSSGSRNSFDQESLVVASDVSELSDPEGPNAATTNGSAPAPKAAADSDSDSYESQDENVVDEEEDDLPIMRPLSWQPISIEHPPTGLGTSVTLPAAQTQPQQPSTPLQPRAQTQPPQKAASAAALPAVASGDSLRQGALDFMLNCLSSRPILPPGELDSSDVAPTRLLLNPYRRQDLENARMPQPPLVAKPLPLDADERRRYERKRDAIKANKSRRRSNRLGSGRGGADGPEGSNRSASYYRSSSALSGRELSFTALSPAVMRRQSRRRSRSRSPETAGGRSKSFTGIGGAVSADALTGRGGTSGAKSDGEEAANGDYDVDDINDYDEDEQLRSATFDARRREWTWFTSNADFVGAANDKAGAGVDPRLRSRSMPIPTSADFNELAVQVDRATRRGRRRRRRRLPPAVSNFVYETSV